MREVEKLHKLQMQVNKLKVQIATEVSQRVFPLIQASFHNPLKSDQDVLANPPHCKKRRKTLQKNIESMPVSSNESGSSNVAIFCCLLLK